MSVTPSPVMVDPEIAATSWSSLSILLGSLFLRTVIPAKFYLNRTFRLQNFLEPTLLSPPKPAVFPCDQ